MSNAYCECGKRKGDEDWVTVEGKAFCPRHHERSVEYRAELDFCFVSYERKYRCIRCKKTSNSYDGWIRVDYSYDYCPDHIEEGIEHQKIVDHNFEISLCVFQMVSKICASQ